MISGIHLTRRTALLGAISSVFLQSSAADAGLVAPAAFILIGAAWCPLCHRAAPTLAVFCERNGLEAMLASADNRPIPPFGEFSSAQGHPLTADVREFPTTFVWSAAVNQVVYSIAGYENQQWYLRQLVAGFKHAEALI